MPKLVQFQPSSEDDLQSMAKALHRAKKIIVLVGSGISTAAGLPVWFISNLILLARCVTGS